MADQPTTPQTALERDKDFISRYANQVYLQPSAWDVQIFFVHLDQAVEPAVARYHTAIAFPWAQIKLAIYSFQLQVAAQEVQLGRKIPIRPDLLPPTPTPLTPEQENIPGAKEFHELTCKFHEEFMSRL